MTSPLRWAALVAAMALVAVACGSTGSNTEGPTSSTEPLPTTEAPIVDLSTEPEEPATTTTTEAGPVLYSGDDDPPMPAQVEALADLPYVDQLKVFALGGTIHAVRGYRSEPGFLQLFRYLPDEEGWEELPTVQAAVGQPLHLDTSGGTLRVSLVGDRSVAEGTRTYLTQDLQNWLEVGTGAFDGAPASFVSSVIPVRNSSFLMEFGPPDDGSGLPKQLVRFDGTGFTRIPIEHPFNWYGGVADGVLTTDLGDPTRGRFSTDGLEWRDIRISASAFSSPSALLLTQTHENRMYVPEVVEQALLLHASDDLGRTWSTRAITPSSGELGSVQLASGPAGIALAVGAPDAVVLFSPDGDVFEVIAEVEALDAGDARGPIRSLAVGSAHVAYSVAEWGVLPVIVPTG